MSDLTSYVEDWRPGPQTVEDVIDVRTARRVADVIELPAPAEGDPLPPLWEWVYFVDWPAKSELNPDGHPVSGAFQPPLPNRRRMWAGGRVEYAGSLRVGEPATRTGTLRSCEEKHGRSGDMLLVSVDYEYAQGGSVVVRERQNHVYRIGDNDAARPEWGPRPAQPPQVSAQWQHPVLADPIDLFRFSAITGNSHRIHYDEPYVTEVEGYAALVVHGPLLGMQLASLAVRNAPGLRLREFDLRLLRPVFAGEPVAAIGNPSDDGGNVTAELQIVSHPDVLHATAVAHYETAGSPTE